MGSLADPSHAHARPLAWAIKDSNDRYNHLLPLASSNGTCSCLNLRIALPRRGSGRAEVSLSWRGGVPPCRGGSPHTYFTPLSGGPLMIATATKNGHAKTTNGAATPAPATSDHDDGRDANGRFAK